MSKLMESLVAMLMRIVFAITPRRFLGSLTWRVDQFVKQWRNDSSDLRRNTWFERLLLGAAAHPWKFLFASVVVWSFIALVPAALATCSSVCLPMAIWGRSDLLTYFGTAWSVQATVVALVYPLVVSFVALLLQRRTTAKVALTAYLLETGVKPAGASSFALLLLMTVQYLALQWMTIEQVQAVMVANVLWLAANLFLTGWFLARTAKYLQDERRVQTLLWLTQCATLPKEVRMYAMGLFLQNAQQQGWVPGSNLADESSGPKVVVFPMGEGRPVVHARHSKPKVMCDVHFKLAGWAIGRWMKVQKAAEGKYPLLELPCTPDDIATTHVLCRIRDGSDPGLFARAAIHASYNFRRPTTSAMPFSSLEVMDELGQEAASLIEQRREPGFRQALADLVDVHSGLLKAARFRSYDGALDSACLLPDPYGWGSRSMAREWMESYRPIAEASVACLELDGRYFSRTAAISARLAYQAGEQPHAVLVELLLSSTLLMYHLGLWWSRQMSSELAPPGHPPRYLPAPSRGAYRDAVQSWVGSWETIDVRVKADEPKRGSGLWSAHATRVKVYAAHIDETARMLLTAVARGDAEAAQRLEDSLVKWWGGRRSEFGADHGVPQPAWNLLTLAFADLGWEHAKASIPELPVGGQTDEAATRLLAIVLRRYWADVCMVTSLLLLEHAAGIEKPETSLSVEIVGALMEGRGYDAGGTADVDRYQGAGAAVARLMRAQFADSAYARRLDKIVERFRSDMQAPMTSGRIYSFSGADDVNSLKLGQALYLTALVAGRHDDLRPYARTVESWQSDLRRLDRISRHFGAVGAEVAHADFLKHSAMLEKLRATLVRAEPPLADAIARASDLCKEAVNEASMAHEKTVKDAPMDPARLVELAQRVHARVFSVEAESEFPIAVVATFEATGDAAETLQQGFTGVSKLPFTTPQLETLDEHNVRWFAQHMGQCVFASALARLQRRHGLEPVRDDHVEAFFADLMARIETIRSDGATPVVLVAHLRRVDFLSPYRLPEDGEVPSGIVIRPPETQERGLHAVVNDVAVYAVPMIASRYLVVPREWLETLQFTTQQGDCGFSVEATNETDGKVDLTFKFYCKFAFPPVH